MEENMSYGSDYKPIPASSVGSGVGIQVLPDLFCYTVQIVNIALIGTKDEFVLVDAGMPNSAEEIISVIEEQFGEGSRPKAIILTHGHFDHVGSIIELIRQWDIPVYAHPLELPFLTGKMSYPEPDPTVEGGMIAKLSSMFPNEAINLGDSVRPLPQDGTIPHIPSFRWIHTPGHTPGHISLFRDEDRTLLAGDAFVTVKQESLYKVMMQEHEISGPPRYFTPDWDVAKQSVLKLEALHPTIAVTGHGLPMTGEELTENLGRLARDFDTIAIPDYGKYVGKDKH
ncbi:MBL fold metallo-hydrolase [Bacillus alkalicellulosilyticus]|uniref:MBL fold metallo-hydrolase n=1 Tax=Alkalihalobacterium alkalicellulosilyticum TaxID=1912214 RepID=UPI000996EB7A|nr:MBL fold metallo-hydrolase [Bacillus alkalicellulosilyticus]